MLDFEHSVVDRSTSSSGRDISQSEWESICATNSMDEEFKKHHSDDLMWAYFGLYNGVIRSFPGTLWDCHRKFDPRVRPW